MTETLETLATPGWDRDPAAVDALVVAGTAGVFWLLGGLPGVALALALGATLFAMPGVLVVALGQVTLAALLPEDPALATVLLGELPLVALLGADVDTELTPQQVGTALLFGGTVLAVSVAATVLAPRLWLAALAVLGVTALFVYGGHRYAVVKYGTRAGGVGRTATQPGTGAAGEPEARNGTGTAGETGSQDTRGVSETDTERELES